MVDTNVFRVAGSGEFGYIHPYGTIHNPRFDWPLGLALTKNGDLLVADSRNHCIRKILLSGKNNFPVVETIAGVAGRSGYRDCTAYQALFSYPTSVAVGADDTIYVTDNGNRRIRTVNKFGPVGTLAGSGNYGLVDGKGKFADFANLVNITSSANKAIFYITDGNRIRKVDVHGTVTTITGQEQAGLKDGHCSEAKFSHPCQIACGSGDSETLYVADYGNHAVRAISLSTMNVRTIVGGNSSGFNDGAIEDATLKSPTGISVDVSGCIFISDYGNRKIRVIDLPMERVSTVVGCTEVGLVDLQYRQCLLLDKSTDTLYFAQQNCIRKVNLQDFLSSLPMGTSLGEDQMLLVDNKDLADVAFEVEGKQIYACKPILIARSPYFARLFSSGMKESHPSRDGRVTTIPIQDAGYNAFRALIVYLITDKVNVDENDWKMACQLLILSDRFLVSKLKSYCERIIAKHIKEENVVEILCFSDIHNTSLLKERAIAFICSNFHIVKKKKTMAKISPFIFEIMEKMRLQDIPFVMI